MIVALCPPLNVEVVVGEVIYRHRSINIVGQATKERKLTKTVAKAEEMRAERRTTLANILSCKGKRSKEKSFREEKFGELLLNECKCLRECGILLCRQN